jgi:hypothetical protein
MARQRHGSSDALVDELFDTTVVLRAFAESRLRPIGSSVARLRALRVLAWSTTAWWSACGRPRTGARSCSP